MSSPVMRIHVIADEGVDVSTSVELVTSQFAGITEVEASRETADMSGYQWRNTLRGYKKIAHADIKADADRIQDTYYGTRDTIFYLIHPDNWVNGKHALWGLHYGRDFAGAEVCLVKARRDGHLTFNHEEGHAQRPKVKETTGEKLEEYTSTPNWHGSVVHAEDERFTEYDYRNAYEMCADPISRTFHIRNKQYNQTVTILQSLIRTLKHLARILTDKDRPTLDPHG